MYTHIFWTFRSSKNLKKYHNFAPKWKNPPRTLKMIKYGTLPFENIAHDLFMVHSLEHPGNMRYSEKVKRLWSVSIGYTCKLSRERFVRYLYISRYKNKDEYWLSGIVLNLLPCLL